MTMNVMTMVTVDCWKDLEFCLLYLKNVQLNGHEGLTKNEGKVDLCLRR